MVLPGHIAGGFIATNIILSLINHNLSLSQVQLMYILGSLSGEIPDIDLLLFYFKKNKKTDSTHREYITHAPLFWLIVSIMISLLGIVIGSKLVIISGIILLAGTWSHFILDSIEDGIRWLWPISNKTFCLIKEKTEQNSYGKKIGSLSYYVEYIRREYFRKVSFYAEIVVVIIAIFIFFGIDW